MTHGEGIKQEQGNIAETGELVTKDVGQLRLVYDDGAGHQPPSNHGTWAGHREAQVRDWTIGIGGTISLLRRVDPGKFHPEPLTDPDVNLSIHPAQAVEHARHTKKSPRRKRQGPRSGTTLRK